MGTWEALLAVAALIGLVLLGTLGFMAIVHLAIKWDRHK